MSETYRVLVTGSRHYADRAALREALDEIGFEHGFRGLIVVHGGARGADSLAEEWVRHNWAIGARQEVHRADWEGICRAECGPHHRRRQRHRPGVTICPAAGNYRNQYMVDVGADECMAFLVAGLPCRGTRDCAHRAEAAGIPVRWFTQDARGDPPLPALRTPARRPRPGLAPARRQRAQTARLVGGVPVHARPGRGVRSGDRNRSGPVTRQPIAEPPCPNEAEHTPCPVGAWPAWWSWAERMNRTHGQRKCEGCGRWAIWYRRAEGELAPCWGCGEAKVDPAKFGEDDELLCGGCVIEREALNAKARRMAAAAMDGCHADRAGAVDVSRRRWRPPWPVQLVGLCVAIAAAALTWTEALRLLGVR